MSPSEQLNWQPISQLPLVASLIDGGVDEAAAQRQILTEARTRPHLLDDATLDRVDQVYGEEQQWLGFCDEQLRRWWRDHPTPLRSAKSVGSSRRSSASSHSSQKSSPCRPKSVPAPMTALWK
jgi:hypothetical protein